MAAFVALAAALLLGSDDVDARFNGEMRPGSGAARTLLLPSTAAAEVTPVPAALDRPSNGQQSGSLGGLFNRPGLLGGFAAGFLGAGLLGLLFGHGLVGELGGVASILGLTLQLALVVLLCRLIWIWWTGRNLPAFVGLSPRQLADPYLRSRNELLPGLGVAPGNDVTEDSSDQHGPIAPSDNSTPSEHAPAHCRHA